MGDLLRAPCNRPAPTLSKHGAPLLPYHFRAGDPRMAGVTVLVLAFIKVRLVAFEFMELREAPLLMKLATDFGIITMLAILVALNLGLVAAFL